MRNRRRLQASLSLLTLAYVACACTGPPAEDTDPLASLTSHVLSGRYTADYWNAQATQGSETWQQAVEICRDDGRRLLPNCTTVSQIDFLRALRKSAERVSKPYDGRGGAPFPDLVVWTMETGTDPLPATDDATEDPPQE